MGREPRLRREELTREGRLVLRLAVERTLVRNRLAASREWVVLAVEVALGDGSERRLRLV